MGKPPKGRGNSFQASVLPSLRYVSSIHLSFLKLLRVISFPSITLIVKKERFSHREVECQCHTSSVYCPLNFRNALSASLSLAFSLNQTLLRVPRRVLHV